MVFTVQYMGWQYYHPTLSLTASIEKFDLITGSKLREWTSDDFPNLYFPASLKFDQVTKKLYFASGDDQPDNTTGIYVSSEQCIADVQDL